jgi:hypothetical protein
MNNRGQAQSIIIFFVLIIGVLIASVVVMRMTNEILTPFQSQIGNMSSQAGSAVANVHTKFNQWWDYFIILLFAINLIILLVSAFLVDIHPAFLIVYIITIIFMFIFGNYALLALDNIWNMMGTSAEQAISPLQQFIINNFMLIMLGVVFLSGIVMYSKFKFFGNMGAGGGNY